MFWATFENRKQAEFFAMMFCDDGYGSRVVAGGPHSEGEFKYVVYVKLPNENSQGWPEIRNCIEVMRFPNDFYSNNALGFLNRFKAYLGSFFGNGRKPAACRAVTSRSS